MRAFIAIELAQNIKTALGALQEELKKSGADVKWVEPRNIHLTLKFLGEINETQIQKISLIIEKIASEQIPFTIHLSSIGAFPKPDYPRVIWVGIDRGDKETQDIAKRIEEATALIGIPKEERAFSSHITIARVRSDLNRQKLTADLVRLANNAEKINYDFQAEKITLFKSTLSPKGALYEILKDASFKTA